MTSSGLQPPVMAGHLDPIPVRLRAEAGRPSAVLVGLMPRVDGWHVIMTERAHHLAHHAGQISFPGGKVDEGDDDLVATALREADEEVALPRGCVEVIGGLGTVMSPFGFVVQPVVGLIDPSVTLRAAPQEVAEVLVLPLAPLLDETRRHRRSYMREGRRREVWVIENERHDIGGLSASILVDLAGRVMTATAPVITAPDMRGGTG